MLHPLLLTPAWPGGLWEAQFGIPEPGWVQHRLDFGKAGRILGRVGGFWEGWVPRLGREVFQAHLRREIKVRIQLRPIWRR